MLLYTMRLGIIMEQTHLILIGVLSLDASLGIFPFILTLYASLKQTHSLCLCIYLSHRNTLGQFHQHSMRSFYIRKLCAQFFVPML